MRHIKDYHRKRYRNPFFQRRDKKSRARRSGFLRKILFAIPILVIIVGAGYFILYSPYFFIKKIEINGLNRISDSQIRSLIDSQMYDNRYYILPQRNIFVFDNVLASKVINSAFVIKFLKIDKQLPDTLKIFVEEKTDAIIWRTGDRFYAVDWDGSIVREINPEEVSGYQTNQNNVNLAFVFDDSNAPVNVRDVILTSKAVQFIYDLQNVLPKETGLVIPYSKTAKSPETAIRVVTAEGWEAIFSNTSDLNKQIEKLKIFLTEKDQKAREGLQYVDLRFEDRVYYK